MNDVINNEERELLLGLLPANYNYRIEKQEIKQSDHNNLQFDLEVRVNVKTVNGVKSFLSELNDSVGCTFNVKSGRPDRTQDSSTARSQYRGYRKCCMNVMSSEDKENRQPGKNTDCEAKLNFRLDNPLSKCKQDKQIKEDFPLWLNLHYQHNHALYRAEFLKYLSVSLDTKTVFATMFEQGYTPSAAHSEMRKRIKADYPDTWPERFADRSILPSIFWSYYWHRQWMDKTIGSRDGIDAYERAQDMVKQFDSECKKKFPLPDGQYYKDKPE